MSDHNQDLNIQEVPSSSPDFHTELAQQLNELVPEAIADGKVDVKKLKELLDGDVEDDSERFGLFWPGKKKAMRAAQLPTTATLKPAKDESKDWDTTGNVFIEGDNLEVLKVLQRHYHGKIKMIYIDPPYNTGKDFVYPDNFKEGLQTYLEFTKQVDEGGKRISTNTDASGRYHSNWLNMIYPRLKLARNLLTDDGVIFISIDDHEVSHLRKVCDEVFGEGNFIAQIIWQKIHSIKNDAKYFSDNHEYVLCYSKNVTRSEILLLPRTKEMNERYANPDNDPRGPWQSGDLVANEDRKDGNYTITSPLGKPFTVPTGKHWVYSKENLEQMIKEERIWFGVDGSAFPRKKRFLSEVQQGRKVSTIWNSSEVGHNQEATREFKQLFESLDIFDNPKPVRILTRLLQLASKNDDLVLDFFSGSATTAHAVMELNAQDGGNRKHIQVQLPEPTDENSEAYKAGYKTIAEIAKERIRRAGEKIKTDYADQLAERETSLDVGFRVYKLSDTNFAKWQVRSDDSIEVIEQSLFDAVENIGAAATEEDLLTELMLKMGLSLTAKAEQIDIAGLNVWSINDGSLMAYLADVKPTLEQLREVASKNPAQLVVLDRCFAGDDELKTNLAQACKTNNIELRTV